MDTEAQLESDINAVTYFWQEKNDLERCCQWDEIKQRMSITHPELIKAWNDYKTSVRTLNAIVRSLE